MISGFTSVYIIWSLKQHCISALKSVVCVCLTISGDLICLDNVSSQSTEHIGCCAFACGDPARQTNQKHFQSLSSSKNGCMCSTSFIKNFRNPQKTKKTGEYNNWNYCRLSTARSKYNRKLCNSCVPWQLKSFNSRNSDFDCAGKQQIFLAWNYCMATTYHGFIRNSKSSCSPWSVLHPTSLSRRKKADGCESTHCV